MGSGWATRVRNETSLCPGDLPHLAKYGIQGSRRLGWQECKLCKFFPPHCWNPGVRGLKGEGCLDR